MSWGKVDDKLYSSPKWMMVSKGGKALWVSALSWCMAQLTDGAVPKRTCSMLGGSTQDARSLVEAGLWTETEDGYQFHDWLDYQPSREQVLSEREAARQRQQKARNRAKASRKRHGVTNGVTHDEVHPPVTGDVTVPPARPGPTPTEPKGSGGSARPRATPLPNDWVPDYSHRERAFGADLDVDAEATKFRTHCLANGRQYVDWGQGFHSWLDKADRFSSPRHNTAGPRTFDQIRHDSNMALWERIKREEGDLPCTPQALEA